MNELQIVKNFLNNMPKAYRKRNPNWVVVRDILLQHTSTAGSMSCRDKCFELGIKPDAYSI